MVVVRTECFLDVEAPYPPLQPVDQPPQSAMEGSGNGDGLECWQIPPHAHLCALFNRSVRRSVVGFPGGQ